MQEGVQQNLLPCCDCLPVLIYDLQQVLELLGCLHFFSRLVRAAKRTDQAERCWLYCHSRTLPCLDYVLQYSDNKSVQWLLHRVAEALMLHEPHQNAFMRCTHQEPKKCRQCISHDQDPQSSRCSCGLRWLRGMSMHKTITKPAVCVCIAACPLPTRSIQSTILVVKERIRNGYMLALLDRLGISLGMCLRIVARTKRCISYPVHW